MMQRHYYGQICDHCGGRLDPGERCDCKDEREVRPLEGLRQALTMEQLTRCHTGDREIRTLKAELADVRLVTAVTGAGDAPVEEISGRLEARRKQHARDMAAVISAVARIGEELTRRVAWGYYVKGKNILSIANAEHYSQEHIRRRLRAAEKMLTGENRGSETPD